MKTAALAATCLFAAALPLHAAQKSSSEVAPQDIDALARAKDAKPAEAATTDAAATPSPADAATMPKDDPAPEAESATEQAAPTEQEPPTGQATPAEPTPANDAAAAAPADDSVPSRPAPLAPPSDAEKSLAAACEARTTALLDAAQKGDFVAASRDFDANMRSKLRPEQFRQAWDSLAQFGALQARGQSHAAQSQGYIAITVPLIFENANLYAQVACGSDGRVAGFYVKPLEGAPAQ